MRASAEGGYRKDREEALAIQEGPVVLGLVTQGSDMSGSFISLASDAAVDVATSSVLKAVVRQREGQAWLLAGGKATRGRTGGWTKPRILQSTYHTPGLSANTNHYPDNTMKQIPSPCYRRGN